MGRKRTIERGARGKSERKREGKEREEWDKVQVTLTCVHCTHKPVQFMSKWEQ